MLKSLKLFLIILGLGIFIFPNQMLIAQNKVDCCPNGSLSNNCCEPSCHSEKSSNNSNKENCGDDCKNCTSCTFHYATNFVSPETKVSINKTFFTQKLHSVYGATYFSSPFQNIWQPPKIG